MKFLWLKILLIAYSTANAQDVFKYLSKKDKIKISFELSNNLVVVPVKINQVKLNFILDTGVDETIIFSLDEKDELILKDTESVKLKGLGDKESINGIYSYNNIVSFNENFIDENHKIIVVLDDLFNISSTLGIPINGIIGSKFFKNNLIEIDYLSQKIIIYKDKKHLPKIEKKYEKIDIELIKSKPYFKDFKLNSYNFTKKLLIDLGNSDALWLFKKADTAIIIPNKNYEDFLGRGFSGEVYGKRGKTTLFEFKKFEFNNIFAAYPDSLSLNNVDLIKDRVGSIGGEILRRFSVIFNYPDQKLYLKKNRYFKEPFYYNISGIDIQHYGKQWVKEEERVINNEKENNGINVFNNQLKFKFVLKPNYNIANVRKNSPADIAGIKKEDILIEINGKNAQQLSLKKINEILKQEIGEEINLVVDRDGKVMRFKFILEDVLN